MINVITWSMLESPSTSDYDEMDNGISKSKNLEPKIKLLMKEISLGSSASLHLVIRGHNIGS